jgi:hypothetical protein
VRSDNSVEKGTIYLYFKDMLIQYKHVRLRLLKKHNFVNFIISFPGRR